MSSSAVVAKCTVHPQSNLEIIVKETSEIICNVCAAQPEYSGKQSIHVKDFMNQTDQKLQSSLSNLDSLIQYTETSNIAQFQTFLRSEIRSFFSKAQQTLRDLQKQKLQELEHTFRDLFGFSIDVEDFKCMSAIGRKHAEYLQKELHQTSNANLSEIFITHYKKEGLKEFLDSAQVTLKNAQKLIDSQVSLSQEMAEEVVKYDAAEVEAALKGLTESAIKLQKVQSRVAKKNKTNNNEVMKEPEQYELKNTYNNIHEDKVQFVDKLSNGNLISGSLDTTIRIWDPVQGQLFRVYEGHTHAVTQILELHNGNLASASLDRTLNVWDRQTAEIIYTLEGFDENITQISELDADNLVILNKNDASFTIWNYKKEMLDNCRYYDDHKATINRLIVVQNKYIFTASSDNTVKRFRLKGDKAEVSFSGHTGPVLDIVFLEDGFLASSSADSTIRIWNNHSKQCQKVLNGSQHGAVNLLFYLNEMKHLLSASQDSTVKIWLPSQDYVCLQTIKLQAPLQSRACLLFLGTFNKPRALKKVAKQVTVFSEEDESFMIGNDSSYQISEGEEDGTSDQENNEKDQNGKGAPTTTDLLKKKTTKYKLKQGSTIKSKQSSPLKKKATIVEEPLEKIPILVTAVSQNGKSKVQFWNCQSGLQMREVSTSHKVINGIIKTNDNKVVVIGDSKLIDIIY